MQQIEHIVSDHIIMILVQYHIWQHIPKTYRVDGARGEINEGRMRKVVK